MEINYFIYYGWVDPKNCNYSVHKYPIIEKQNITGVETYVVDKYLFIDEHHSTCYIEEYYLDKEIQPGGDRVGLMSLDHAKVLKWVKEQKLKLESRLLDDLQKIQEAKIDDCGEAVYV